MDKMISLHVQRTLWDKINSKIVVWAITKKCVYVIYEIDKDVKSKH